MSNGVDIGRRRFLTNSTAVVGAVGGVFGAVPFVVAWTPTARAKALGAPTEIDISKLEPGMRIVGEWRRQPVWVVSRTAEALNDLKGVESKLRDPASDKDQQPEYARNQGRSRKPEILVLIGICTHLGCAPLYLKPGNPPTPGEDWKGGFFCPCHGSRFDLAGRVFQAVPAPLNLKVPPHYFVDDDTIVIGVDQGDA